MSTTKISGSAYIIIGVAMMLMSLLIDKRLEKLLLFVFVGAIFVLVGFVKILIKESVLTKEHSEHLKRHKTQKHTKAKNLKIPTPGAHQDHKPPTHKHHTQVFRCSACKVKLHPNFKFCPNCGQKLD